jgi:hypothetical protein
MSKMHTAIFFSVLLIPTILYAELTNYRDYWKNWTDDTRTAYLSGYVDGSLDAFVRCFPAERFEGIDSIATKTIFWATYDSIMFKFELNIIRDVMTSLYNDPANSFIPFSCIARAANKKLLGEEIEPFLQYQRKLAVKSDSLGTK